MRPDCHVVGLLAMTVGGKIIALRPTSLAMTEVAKHYPYVIMPPCPKIVGMKSSVINK